MKKHLLKVIGILALSASAFAIAPDQMGPPITQGNGVDGSSTQVRVTANVVSGIAVNEASPIDFGNLVRGDMAYQPGEQINERTPGLVVYRGDNVSVLQNKISSWLDTDMINLTWQNSNGTDPTDKGTNTTIRRVRITGLGEATGVAGAEDIDLVNGQAQRTLHAWFSAYDKADLTAGNDDTTSKSDGNLGKNQRLGSYLGSVYVHASVK